MSGQSVVIVDYGLGNLFSVQRALNMVGAKDTKISHDQADIENAGRVVLPGVGAFGDGMKNLEERELVSTLQKYAESGRPILGVCLGMQLIMSQSEEFGLHAGLDLVPGNVRRLESDTKGGFKIPHIGWNALEKSSGNWAGAGIWDETVLDGIEEGASMYFNHSFIVVPEDQSVSLATTNYGKDAYCSVLRMDNITGAQFHPELSGEDGMRLYRNFIHNS